jgi:hypothetical protein
MAERSMSVVAEANHVANHVRRLRPQLSKQAATVDDHLGPDPLIAIHTNKCNGSSHAGAVTHNHDG